MSISFDAAAHPRTTDGKFTTKALADAGTDVDLDPWDPANAPADPWASLRSDDEVMADPAWMGQTGVPLTQAPSWDRLGFEPGEAASFIAAEVDAPTAYRWRHEAGVSGQDVAPWIEHGFEPDTAAEWLAAGCPPPTSTEELPAPASTPAPKNWGDCQHIAPEQGYAWDAADFSPEEADAYAEHGCGVQEASEWRAAGVPAAAVPTRTGAGLRASSTPDLAAQDPTYVDEVAASLPASL